MTYPRAAGADHRDDIFGGVGNRQREEHDVRQLRAHAAEHLGAAAVGHVDVEQHDLRTRARDAGDRFRDRPGLADHLHLVGDRIELRAHSRAEQRVVVHEEDLDRFPLAFRHDCPLPRFACPRA